MALNKKIIGTHYHVIYPFFLVLFLTLTLFLTVNQSQKNQAINSNAETALTTNCTVSAAKLATKTEEQNLFGLINTYRTQNNVDHLIWNNTLKQSAAWQSADMLAHNSLSHVDSLNRTPDIRLENCGYDINNGYGENIAEGSSLGINIFNAWKNDPPHNQILLNPKYNIAGIDVEVSSSGNAFWTMDFGSSATPLNPTPTLTSNIPTPTTAPTTAVPTTVSNAPSISSSPSNSAPSVSLNPSISQNPNQPTPTDAPVTADMQIAVQVQINGIGKGGNTNPLHKTRHITALVYGPGALAVTTGTAFLTYDGSNYFIGTIHLGKLSQGAYFIKLVSDNTLQVLAKPEFQNLIINRINTIPPVTLYQGDMNADNVLDIDDYNIVLPCFQDKNCNSANLIDFNDDGKTDVSDYNLLLQSFEILHGN